MAVRSCDLFFHSLDFEYRHRNKGVQLVDRLQDVFKHGRACVFIGKSGGMDAGLFDGKNLVTQFAVIIFTGRKVLADADWESEILNLCGRFDLESSTDE